MAGEIIPRNQRSCSLLSPQYNHRDYFALRTSQKWLFHDEEKSIVMKDRDKPSQVVTKTIFLLQDSLTWKATVVVARVVLVPAEQSVAERRFPDSGLSQQDDCHHLAFRDRQSRREGQDKSELSTPGHPDETDAAKFFGTDAFST